MTKELTIQKTEQMMLQLETVGQIRITKQLNNGNLAILQVVDPEDVPDTTKVLRTLNSRFGKWLCAVEAAFRVGKIVYSNAMRPKGKRQGNSKSDRKAKKL